MQEKHYKELYELLQEAFVEMHALVKKSTSEHKYIFSHYDFPKLSDSRENGMPSLSVFYGIDGPKDYSSLFVSRDDEHHYNLMRITSFQNIRNYLFNHENDLKEHIYFSNIEKLGEHAFDLLKYDILAAFDCYMHENDSQEFNEQVFQEIILRLYNQLFLEELPISICVPILMVRFEDESIPITDNIQIRKLTDKELLSSYRIGSYSDTYELFVVSSATHILELKNYIITNSPMFSWCALEHKEAYPLEIIDKWFAAFRIVTHIESGYGQILSFPDGWGIRKGNLIDVHGDKIFKFNYKYVTNKMWNNDTPLVTTAELKPVFELYNFFLNNTSNSLNIAIRRLNLAYLRESDEDAIIDLVIAIEALVTDHDHGEITYKVSTRTAFILSTLPDYPYTIAETQNAIKKLYAFRSKVVHGASKIDKSRIIKVRKNIEKDSVALAMELLQFLILAISKRSEFLNSQNIDTFFLEKYESMMKMQLETNNCQKEKSN